MKKIILLNLMLLGFMLCQAQSRITGTVTDANNESLPGAYVLMKGTDRGTITDFDGGFSLDASSNDVLVISYIGYITKEVQIGTQSVINVILIEDITSLQEVVVIGYGSQKKKVVTGAIASVSAEQITSTPVLRVEQALQGRTPGVQVTNLSGQPGEAPTVRIRGTGTTGNSNPLYIVDGLPVGGIDYLNPGDIESMDVLKDAASAAIYGARAANGVVLITTKSGTKGKLSVSYSGYLGIQNVARKIEMLNADQYKIMMNEGARNAGLTEEFDLNEIPSNDTDWQEELFQNNTPMSSHQISVSGGGEKSTFASSISKFSQQGIIGGGKSQFDRYSVRLNSNHKVNKMFSFGNNLAYTHIIRRGIGSNQSFNGAFSSALNMDPLTPVYETDGDILALPPYSNQPVVTNGGNVYGISNYVGAEVVNPLALLETQHPESRVDKLVGNIYGELEPIEGLKYKTSFGIDLAYVLNDDFRPLFYLNGAQNNTEKTSVNKSIERYFTWQWENTITYSKKIGDHNIGGLIGVSALEANFENLTGFNSKVPTSDPDNVYLNLATDTAWVSTGGASQAALYSTFGRITYDYKDKYSFTGIIRRDGSSKFGANKRFGIFPSVGFAWIASDEVFLQNRLGPINLLKFRVSWGVNGNQEIGDNQFVSVIDKTRGYTFGGGRIVGSSPLYIENQDVQWEESKQLDIAVDMGLIENKLTITIDYYKKTTEKLLEIISIPGHVGNNPPVVNAGSVENKGIELAINWRENRGDFNYSIGLNGAYNKNTMTQISNEEKVLPGASWAIAGQVTRAEQGFPIAYFWGYKTAGIFQNQTEIFQHINSNGDVLQPNAKPGDVRFVDVNGDGVINPDDRTKIGNPTPDVTYGFNASVDYKGIDFSFLFQGTIGNDVFNGMQRQDLRYTNRPTSILDRWNGEGTSNTVPRYTWIDTNNNYRVSDLYIENGSYLRLKNIQIGYSLPESILDKIGASKCRFYVSAENLFTITKYTGADPEIGALSSFDIGIDRAIYPQARTFRLGATLTF
jgi:TonB-dependent starch-binding outer membrane protein SusC